MSELQPLPSSMRENHRYLVFEIVDGPKGFSDVVSALWDAVIAFCGEQGSADAGIWIMKDRYNEEDGRGLVRVRQEMVVPVRAAMTLVSEIAGQQASIRVIGITGTVDSAEETYLNEE